jgi:hypothetical protein
MSKPRLLDTFCSAVEELGEHWCSPSDYMAEVSNSYCCVLIIIMS